MIEDNELNDLFRQESREHLDALEAGVLLLEQDSSQVAVQEDLMREAHSLKGAARMLDLQEIEALSHEVETTLRAHIESGDEFNSDVTRQLLRAIDELREMSRVAVEGDVAEPPDMPPVAPPIAGAANQTESEQTPVEPAAEATLVEESAATRSKQQLDTIRVTADKLDRLMTHSSELLVMEKRLSNQIADLNELGNLLDTGMQLQRELERQVVRQNTGHTLGGITSLLSGLGEVWERFSEKYWAFNAGNAQDIASLQNIAARLDYSVRDLRQLPLSILFEQFSRMIRDLSADLGKPVKVVLDGSDLMVDKRVIEDLKDPLMHLIRNALEHGIEPPEERLSAGKLAEGMIKLRGIRTVSAVMIEVEDDGRGLNLERIKAKASALGLMKQNDLAGMSVEQIQQLIFRSGLSTQDQVTEISGRGVGLDVVSTAVSRLKGEIVVNSHPAHGAGFRLIIPQNFATTNVTLVEVKGQTYAVPVDSIHSIRFVHFRDVNEVGGQTSIKIEDQSVSLVLVEELLGLQTRQRSLHDAGQHVTVVVSVEGRLLALVVDQVLEEQSIIIKPVGAFLKRVRNITGVGLLSNGDIVALLSPVDLISTVRGQSGGASFATDDPSADAKRILLAEDSMITRTQEKRILESAGYEVIIAVDGQEAWNKINTVPVDAVVSDIMMPNVDGFELTRRIRADKKFRDIPIVLVTTLSSDEDRKRGLDLGANAYIPKGGFNQKMLLDALARLIGATSFE